MDGADPDVLASMTPVLDPGGKSYFLVPVAMSGPALRRAVLATLVHNAGSGYGADPECDFPATPFTADEVFRIRVRQRANSWSYGRALAMAVATGARLVTTPNGMLMGAGGNWPTRLFSQRGGTTWGDVFVLNAGKNVDATTVLLAATAAAAPVYERGARLVEGRLHLDRLLHHEEIHSQQWARYGRTRFAAAYLREQSRAVLTGQPNRFEVEAGLRDGGYA
ncbi:hypothetical protein HUN08_16000 [Gordonia sp. X0973]|uniref:hypothetical protein n=1 Tax=Gordonia sp. X0973 TaxID=2742602 RepID=UPI000F547CBB|nr:hypothetical protein [Gordonia sp. X0973]QKT08534.1 hypothetical protein HUN08_16000 [Gordonia sp. X0973]